MRAVLNRRSLGLLVLALAMASIAVRLGFWQMDVARSEGRERAIAEAAAKPVEPLQQLTEPHSAFTAQLSARRTTVAGRYLPEHTVVVTDHRLGERSGSWVVTPLQVDGAVVAVLRGFVDGSPDPAQLPPAPEGTVTVAGVVGPGESPRREGGGLTQGRMPSLNLAVLVNVWPGELYNVVVFAQSEQASDGAAIPAEGLTRVPPPEADRQLNLKNAMYAVQWWVFAAFFVWMWWKMMRAPQRPAVPGAADAAQRHRADERMEEAT